MNGTILYERVKLLLEILEGYPDLTKTSEIKAIKIVNQVIEIVDRRKGDRRNG